MKWFKQTKIPSTNNTLSIVWKLKWIMARTLFLVRSSLFFCLFCFLLWICDGSYCFFSFLKSTLWTTTQCAYDTMVCQTRKSMLTHPMDVNLWLLNCYTICNEMLSKFPPETIVHVHVRVYATHILKEIHTDLIDQTHNNSHIWSVGHHKNEF